MTASDHQKLSGGVHGALDLVHALEGRHGNKAVVTSSNANANMMLIRRCTVLALLSLLCILNLSSHVCDLVENARHAKLGLFLVAAALFCQLSPIISDAEDAIKQRVRRTWAAARNHGARFVHQHRRRVRRHAASERKPGEHNGRLRLVFSLDPLSKLGSFRIRPMSAHHEVLDRAHEIFALVLRASRAVERDLQQHRSDATVCERECDSCAALGEAFVARGLEVDHDYRASAWLLRLDNLHVHLARLLRKLFRDRRGERHHSYRVAFLRACSSSEPNLRDILGPFEAYLSFHRSNSVHALHIAKPIGPELTRRTWQQHANDLVNNTEHDTQEPPQNHN
mmetsp:Transcript_8088/g.17408  ORF Transcript_8088/g.17408 Transcript_8088/m.17408 type:complete len:339 (-) Transcript_8088:97-1113(-)